MSGIDPRERARIWFFALAMAAIVAAVLVDHVWPAAPTYRPVSGPPSGRPFRADLGGAAGMEALHDHLDELEARLRRLDAMLLGLVHERADGAWVQGGALVASGDSGGVAIPHVDAYGHSGIWVIPATATSVPLEIEKGERR